MSNHYHVVTTGQRSDQVLAGIKWRERRVRFWFSSNGTLVGIWQSRLGKTYAVGHDRCGRVIVYRAGSPHDDWANG